MTMHRPSVSWTIPGPLSTRARDVLADYLDCRFTDENEPRPVMQTAPDVQMVVIPEERSCTVVAHFAPAEDMPETDEAWLSDWVAKAARQAGMPTPSAARPVRTGPRKAMWHTR